MAARAALLAAAALCCLTPAIIILANQDVRHNTGTTTAVVLSTLGAGSLSTGVHLLVLTLRPSMAVLVALPRPLLLAGLAPLAYAATLLLCSMYWDSSPVQPPWLDGYKVGQPPALVLNAAVGAATVAAAVRQPLPAAANPPNIRPAARALAALMVGPLISHVLLLLVAVGAIWPGWYNGADVIGTPVIMMFLAGFVMTVMMVMVPACIMVWALVAGCCTTPLGPGGAEPGEDAQLLPHGQQKNGQSARYRAGRA